MSSKKKHIILISTVIILIAADFIYSHFHPSDYATIEATTAEIESKQDLLRSYVKQAWAWKDKGELEKAINKLSEAIELEAQIIQLHSQRGNAWIREGEIDKALADYQNATELDRALSPYLHPSKTNSKLPEHYSARGKAWLAKIHNNHNKSENKEWPFNYTIIDDMPHKFLTDNGTEQDFICPTIICFKKTLELDLENERARKSIKIINATNKTPK